MNPLLKLTKIHPLHALPVVKFADVLVRDAWVHQSGLSTLQDDL